MDDAEEGAIDRDERVAREGAGEHGLQLPLFDRRRRIADAFAAFHAANPRVYTELVRLAREWRARRRERLGIGMLWEVLRWQIALATKGDEFKLNNNFRSRYARLIMEREADLDGLFETRELRAP